MSVQNRILRQQRNARRAAQADPTVNKFALFGETLLLGVSLFVLGLPVVTAPAAYAAGAAHLERHLAGRPDSLTSLWADFRVALPGSWKFGLMALAAAAITAVNLLLAASQQLPGGRMVLIATVILAAGVAMLLLRTAAQWQHRDTGATGTGINDAGTNHGPQARWAGAWAQAKDDARADLVGTVLLVAAMVMTLVFVWMLPPLVFIVPGALVLAVVSVRFRATAR